MGEQKTSGYYRDEFGRMARFYDVGLRFAFRFIGGEAAFRNEIILAAAADPGLRVLDINCGTGTLALLLADKTGSRVTGIDLSPEMIAMARGKLTGGAVTFIVANAEELPFPAESFDRATMSLAYHEMNREGRKNALAEAWRVLAPGGRLVIADLRAPDTLFTRIVMRILRLWETDTLTDMWRQGVDRELAAAGFTIVDRRITGRRFFELVTAAKPD